MGNRVARWVALLPLVLVGSMMFWSVALGLGGLSLLAVSGLTTGDEAADQVSDEAPDVRDVAPSIEATVTEPVSGHADPITVHIQPSAEPEDLPQGVMDSAGIAASAR